MKRDRKNVVILVRCVSLGSLSQAFEKGESCWDEAAGFTAGTCCGNGALKQRCFDSVFTEGECCASGFALASPIDKHEKGFPLSAADVKSQVAWEEVIKPASLLRKPSSGSVLGVQDLSLFEFKRDSSFHWIFKKFADEPGFTIALNEQHDALSRPGAWAWVIGAHAGAFTSVLLRRYPLLRVLAVEPVPTLFRYLLLNLREQGFLDRVLALNVAVAAANETSVNVEYDPKMSLHTCPKLSRSAHTVEAAYVVPAVTWRDLHYFYGAGLPNFIHATCGNGCALSAPLGKGELFGPRRLPSGGLGWSVSIHPHFFLQAVGFDDDQGLPSHVEKDLQRRINALCARHWPNGIAWKDGGADGKKYTLCFGRISERKSPGNLAVVLPLERQVEHSFAECLDETKFCEVWAKSGECDKNKAFMQQKCRKACGSCSHCYNDALHCDSWAIAGECERNRKFMMQKCKKACGACYLFPA